MTITWAGKSNRRHFLRHLIETNDYCTMAEVGVRDGRTTFWLLDHIPRLTIYAIDISIRGFYTREAAVRYGDRLRPIEAASSIAADRLSDHSLDLVFIDANHSYRHVREDIIKYSAKLRPGGLLAGHDIDYPGVNQAVRELIPRFDVGPNNVWVRQA